MESRSGVAYLATKDRQKDERGSSGRVNGGESASSRRIDACLSCSRSSELFALAPHLHPRWDHFVEANLEYFHDSHGDFSFRGLDDFDFYVVAESFDDRC